MQSGPAGAPSAASASSSRSLTVLILCDTDSQVFGTIGLARAFAAAGCPVTYGVFGRPLPETARRLLDPFETIELGAALPLNADLVARFDVVGFYSHGSQIQAFRSWFGETFARPAGERPVIFTGFNGLVLDKFEEGIAWRAGYDVIVVAGPRDVEAFHAAYGRTMIADQPLVACGVGFANVTQRVPRNGPRRKLVFAEQSVIPSSLRDRLWLMGQLCRLAAASPGWDVVVKVRVAPGGQTFHPFWVPMELLAQVHGRVPSNLVLTSAPLAGLLAEADVVATVSSTAVLEAIRSGIPAVVVGDFGVSNTAGSQVFLQSGLMVALSGLATLDDLDAHEPDAAWLATLGVTGAAPSSLVEALRNVVKGRRELPRQFYGPDGAMRLPARFACPEVASRARLALRAGDAGSAAELLEVASRLEPGSRRLKVLADFAAGRIRRWEIGPRMVAGAIAGFVRISWSVLLWTARALLAGSADRLRSKRSARPGNAAPAPSSPVAKG